MTLIGYGGNDRSSVPEIFNQASGCFMGRESWDNITNMDWIEDGPVPADIASNANRAVVMGVPLIPHDSGTSWNTLLDQAAAGTHNSKYYSLGQKMAQLGARTVYARVWWEFNMGDEYPNTTKFKAAWQVAIPQIRNGFNAAKTSEQQLKIVLCSMPDRDHSTQRDAYYPGSGYVDVVSYDVYGKTYASSNQSKATVLAEV